MSIGARPLASCSSLAVCFPKPLFGRNYDFFYRLKRRAESCLTMPKGGYWSIGNSDVFIGREDGINEAGLAVSMAFVAPKEIKPGINFALAVRAILDRCSSVAEAIRLLSNARLSTTNNYLLLDKDGDAAAVEASPNKIAVRKSEGGILVVTNHFTHRGMGDEENVNERPPDSVMRYEKIMSMIGAYAGKVDLKSAIKVLSDHKGLVCSHVKEIRLGTLWSMVAFPSERALWMAEGHPCKAHYMEDLRLKRALAKRVQE